MGGHHRLCINIMFSDSLVRCESATFCFTLQGAVDSTYGGSSESCQYQPARMLRWAAVYLITMETTHKFMMP